MMRPRVRTASSHGVNMEYNTRKNLAMRLIENYHEKHHVTKVERVQKSPKATTGRFRKRLVASYSVHEFPSAASLNCLKPVDGNQPSSRLVTSYSLPRGLISARKTPREEPTLDPFLKVSPNNPHNSDE